LDLSYNNITKLPTNPSLSLPRLIKLSLKKNNLRFLSGIEKFPSLTYLKLSRNNLSNMNEIKRLGLVKGLKGVSLYRNPVSEGDNQSEYIKTLINTCQNLESLDHVPVE
jgi:Leucine-rich repeat (LRR) protein